MLALGDEGKPQDTLNVDSLARILLEAQVYQLLELWLLGTLRRDVERRLGLTLSSKLVHEIYLVLYRVTR